MNSPLEILARRLKSIADKNGDAFDLNVRIKVWPNSAIHFYFQAEESADRHVFVDGSGATLDQAVDEATKQIPQSLADWDYKETE